MLTQVKSSSIGRVVAKRSPILDRIRLLFAWGNFKGNFSGASWWGVMAIGLLTRKIYINRAILITLAIFVCSDIQAASTSLPTPYFKNVTENVGLNNVSGFRVSVADVNGDDYPDLLLHQIPDEVRGDVPCRKDRPDDVYTCKDQFLYLNVQGDNVDEPISRKFVDFTEESGIRLSRRGAKDRRSNLAVFADVDNDGDLDMFSGIYGHRVETGYNDNGDRNDLFLNDGSGHFTLSRNSHFHHEKFWNTSSAVFLDYDRDGNIDLFTGNGWLENFEVDQLYRGHADGSFANVTNSVGIDVEQPTYAATAADTNNDGFIDLFSGNYCQTHSAHWQNNGDGTFSQKQQSTNYGEYIGVNNGGKNTCSWGSMPRDFDNDGDIDFFELIVHGKESAIHSTVLVNLLTEGNREYFDWNFDKIVRPNDPEPTHHRDHYGSWFDIDNDGLADFILSQSDHLDLFKQEAGRGFEIVNDEAGLDEINALDLSIGNAIPLDYDLDGDEDLLIGFDGKQNEVQLWRNDVGTLNNRLTVILEGGGADGFSNKSAIGARVEVITDGSIYTRDVYAGNGHFGPQAPLNLTFGIAQSKKVDEIRVYWPNRTGTTNVLRDIDVNQFIHIHEVDHNVNAYFPALTSNDEDVEITPEPNRICEPGFTAGTYTIRARFENTFTDTTISNLVFRVEELSGGPILCNADGAAGGKGATVTVARADDYADGLLGPGEHFFQIFEVGLDDLAPFTLLVDLLGSIAIDETAPSLIQSTLGPEENNLEVVVREADNKLYQYFRGKDDNDDFIWLPGSEAFAEGATSAPSLIQSTLGPEENNLEVVVRGPDRQLHQYFRKKDQNDNFVWIEGSEPFAPDSTSAASLIQSTFGPEGNNNLEVVVRESDNRLHHYFREKDDQGDFVWKSGGKPFANNVTSAPAFIQSDLGEQEDNFEVVVRQSDNQLHHYFRERVSVDPDVFEWKSGGAPFAENVTSAPSLIQSTLGPDGDNLEVIVRQADNKLHHYFRERVADEPEVFEWKEGGVVEPAEDVMSGPSLIQGTLGPLNDNFELVVREGDEVRHYFRERISTDPEVFEWKFGGVVTQ